MKRTKRILRKILWTFITLGIASLLAGVFIIYHYTKGLPTITKSSLQSDASSNMYASNGRKIWSSAINKRIYVKYQDLPKTYINLLLSTEDRNFYHDRGVSPKGFANAVLSYGKSNLGLGEARGGSSLEQQLIKLTAYSTSMKDRTIKRKVQEMFLAQQLDHNFSKNKILELYVNKIFLGEGSYGAQTIAHTYFGKDLRKLNLSQLAIIAGLGQAGSYYNLYDRPNAVKIRRNQVLKAALSDNKITKEQYRKAKSESVTYGLKKRYWEGLKLKPIEEKHASFINSALTELSNSGYDLTKTPLQIHTSLDEKIDNEVRITFDKHPEFFQNHKQQAAITITDPRTGHVLSQNGGRFTHNVVGLNRATSTQRSTGSSIKPINDYGPALEYLGWNTEKMLDSSPYHYAGTTINATNFGGASYGMVTMQRAISESMNTPAIRTLDAVGPTLAKMYTGKLGISQKEPIAGSYALGMNASTAQMASAYGAYANYGVYKSTEYINYLVFPDESVKHLNDKGKQVITPATAYIMTQLLKHVITDKNGTLHQGEIKGLKMAAKTGTVAYPNDAKVPDDSAMDFWTVGYTRNLVIALWEGYDRPMAKDGFLWDMKSITLRAKLWKHLIPKITKGRVNKDWYRPKGVIGSGDNLRVAHPLKYHPLTKTIPTKFNRYQEGLYDIKTVKKNPQTRYDIPKNYHTNSWRKAYDKAKAKQEKQDDKLYGKSTRADE